MTSLAHRDAEIIYLDVNLSTGSYGITPLQKTISRSGNIVNHANDYMCAVIRAVIPCGSVWMFQPVFLQDGDAASDGYNTIYTITLTHGAFTSASVSLQAINVDASVPPPTTPLTSQPTNGWGAVYSYSSLVDMLNTALSTAYASLLAQVPTLNAQPPYYTYSPASQMFVMNAYPLSQYSQNQAGIPDVVKIYFNNESGTPWLVGWKYVRLNNSIDTTTGKDLCLTLETQANNWIEDIAGAWSSTPSIPPNNPNLPIDADKTMIQMSQQFPATWAFTALSSIQIVSTLPTVPEFTDIPLAQIGFTPSNQSTSILQDFTPDYSADGAGSWAAPLVYNAFSVVNGARFCQLVGSSQISYFDLKVNWCDSFGNVYPLTVVSPNQNASIKLMFVKKSIVDATTDLHKLFKPELLSDYSIKRHNL